MRIFLSNFFQENLKNWIFLRALSEEFLAAWLVFSKLYSLCPEEVLEQMKYEDFVVGRLNSELANHWRQNSTY